MLYLKGVVRCCRRVRCQVPCDLSETPERIHRSVLHILYKLINRFK